jgi:hypothetical protein
MTSLDVILVYKSNELLLKFIKAQDITKFLKERLMF